MLIKYHTGMTSFSCTQVKSVYCIICALKIIAMKDSFQLEFIHSLVASQEEYFPAFNKSYAMKNSYFPFHPLIICLNRVHLVNKKSVKAVLKQENALKYVLGKVLVYISYSKLYLLNLLLHSQ